MPKINKNKKSISPAKKTVRKKKTVKLQPKIKVFKKNKINKVEANKKDVWGKFFIFVKAALIFIILAVVITIASFYLGDWKDPSVKKLAKLIPLPVAKVNNQLIFSNKYIEDMAALSKFLDRQGIDYSESQLKKQVLDSLIEKSVVIELAKNQQIEVSQQDITDQLSLVLENGQSQAEIEEVIKELYDWEFEKYIDKVIKPLVLINKLQENFYNNSNMAKIKDDMENYYQQLSVNPEKFEEIASKVNEDSSKYIGGDLGWFALGDMPPEFEFYLLEMSEGDISPVVETSYGFHIIKLKQKLIEPETGQTIFSASHIFKAKDSFKDYLDEQIKKATVVTLIKI